MPIKLYIPGYSILQRGGVDKPDSADFPRLKSWVYMGRGSAAGQFHEPVAADRKPQDFFCIQQTMGFATAFKSLAQIIDIAVYPCYNIFVHRNSSCFPYDGCFGLYIMPDSGGAFFSLSNSRYLSL
jgi:hypothetical protein